MFKTKSMAIKVTTSVVKCLKNVFGIDISEEYYLKETSYSARFLSAVNCNCMSGSSHGSVYPNFL